MDKYLENELRRIREKERADYREGQRRRQKRQERLKRTYRQFDSPVKPLSERIIPR